MEFLAVLGLLKLFTKLSAGECISNRCLLGKTALVTGGSTGIGYETAIALAARGCRVIVADNDKENRSTTNMIAETENTKIIYKNIDLASFESIRSFVNDMNITEQRLDILINNASSSGYRGVITPDGLSKTMQINHFGPFLLTYLLSNLLKKTENSRIVFVSSIMAFFHRINTPGDMSQPPNIKGDIKYNLIEFNNSKLCSLIAACCFAEKLRESGVMCNCVHPGMVDTNLFVSSVKHMKSNKWDVTIANVMVPPVIGLYAKTPTEGAQTSLHCALSSLNVTGRFFVDCREFIIPVKAQLTNFRWMVWDETKRIVNIKPEEQYIR